MVIQSFLTVLQPRAEEPRAGAKPSLWDIARGIMRETSFFSLTLSLLTVIFGVTHFCAIPFLNNTTLNSGKGVRKKKVALEHPQPSRKEGCSGK